VADLAAVRDAFFQNVAAQNDLEFTVHAGFHQWIVGGNGLRARGGDGAGGSCWKGRAASGAACFASNDAGGVCYDSRMPGDAVAG